MKTINVVMSEKCNLDCSYCNVEKTSKKTIDPDLCLAEYKKLRQQYPDERIKIDFFGGEPLLQMPMVKYIIEQTESDPNVQFFMPTNGLLLDDEKVDYLVSKNVQLSLSFDGLWQDKNRLQLNGKGTVHRYLEKRELFKRIPNLRCHTMVTKGTYNLLENYLWIKEHFGLNAELTLVRDVGMWNAASVERLKTGIESLFNWYVEHPEDGMPNLVKHYWNHVLNYHNKKITLSNCGAGISVVMFSENKLYPCTRFKDSPELLEKIPQFRQMPQCETCSVKNYCNKGCLIEQIRNDGPIEELCDIYRFIYSKVISMSAQLQNNPHFLNALKHELEQDYEDEYQY